jgi:flagellar biosynthesis/type III secretory pathway protein FliH
MKRYEELYRVLTSAQDDFRKFYEDGNKAAGTRVRKAMMELRNLAQEIRQEVQEMKNAG